MPDLTIYKYALGTPKNTTKLLTRKIVKWLHVDTQRNQPTIWAVVDLSSQDLEEHILYLRGTGHPLSGQEGEHLGTFQMDGGMFVFHLFAEK